MIAVTLRNPSASARHHNDHVSAGLLYGDGVNGSKHYFPCKIRPFGVRFEKTNNFMIYLLLIYRQNARNAYAVFKSLGGDFEAFRPSARATHCVDEAKSVVGKRPLRSLQRMPPVTIT